MANTASNYQQANRLNWLKGTAYPAAPATTYIALFTVAPTNAGGGTEVSGGSYARQAVASSAWAALSGTSPTQTSNANVIDFGVTTGAWGTAVAFGLFDAATGGNLLWWSALTANKTINSGDDVNFQIGALVVQED
jgi:hypothetical protein